MDFGNLETDRASLIADQNAIETTCSSSAHSPSKDGGMNEPVTFASISQKKVGSKESPRTSLNSLNKFKSQIKKPGHRNGSPLNWIPRQKGDTYLKRKIKLLQEASGMKSTLDETLGTANPHYCRVLREKMASRQAAANAMEARKAAMVEASWCRILKAARIQSKEAEEMLLKAEKKAAETIEAAAAKGVMMYDSIDYTQKQSTVETSSAVKALFETAFEVDRQVAGAVRNAFIRLAANCPSSLNKDEYIVLLRKISEKPNTDETKPDLSACTSECEPDVGLEFELGSEDASSSQSVNQFDEEMKSGSSLQKYNKETLVDMMLERLKCLKEEELASLATIVATCGLNAALAEMENQQQGRSSYASCNSRRVSTFGGRKIRNSSTGLIYGPPAKQPTDVELPSLDKCLVKHMTKLEREVQEARIARKNDSREEDTSMKSDESGSSEDKDDTGLGSILIKHSSKLEREKADLKRKIELISELDQQDPEEERGKGGQVKQKVEEVPSLDKFLVKHVSRLEREVEEAKSRRNGFESTEKENVDSNKDQQYGDDQTKHSISKREAREKELQETWGGVSLGKGEGGLDSILVKHKSKLEHEKIAAAQNDGEQTKHLISRQKAREKELQEAWGGMSLGNCTRPHLSRLERDKAAWIKAEEGKQAALREL